MEMQQLKSKKQNLSRIPTDKKSFIIGSIVATIIAITPYLFYSYRSVPSTPTWYTFIFTFKSHYYEDANTAIWSLMVKAIPLLLLVIWFFTCRHWWYHTILVPIAMYIYQLVGAFNDEMAYIDEVGLEYLIPIMAIIIPSIYLIRAKMFNRINSANQTMQDLEDEFKIKPKGLWGKVKQYF